MIKNEFLKDLTSSAEQWAKGNKPLETYLESVTESETNAFVKDIIKNKKIKEANENFDLISELYNDKILQEFYLKGITKGLNEGIISTFRGGVKDPFHSWFPYLEGYSPDFVKGIIYRYHPEANSCYDPFGGSGTTPITASKMGIDSFYSEVSPLMRFLIDVKSNVLSLPSKNKTKLVDKLKFITENISDISKFTPDKSLRAAYVDTFGDKKYFYDKDYELFLKSKSFINSLDDALMKDVLSVAVVGICIEVSLLKRQGDIRYKNEKELKSFTPCFFTSLKTKLNTIISDISLIPSEIKPSILLTQNARSCDLLPKEKVDIVVTSPPYINGTNYIRNTKLELWFLGYLKHQDELRSFRSKVITAGINDVQKEKNNSKMHYSLKKVWDELNERVYDKRIPQMINDYFYEMEDVVRGISKVLKKGGIAAIDIGDSVYAGVQVPVFDAYKEIALNYNLELVEDLTLRTRRSKDNSLLRQALLVFKKVKSNKEIISLDKSIEKKWNHFKTNLPHQEGEFNKRNWGNSRHSLCSYQGKLKPSIAKHLVEAFVPEGGSVLDPFSGVGTIPFEAALSGRKSFGFDISPVGYNVSLGKVSDVKIDELLQELNALDRFIKNSKLQKDDFENARKIKFNKELVDYYEKDTFEEILLARKYFMTNSSLDNRGRAFVLSCLLHVLHGNRPYALSRRSHPITPFAPTGEFEYRSVVQKIRDKINLSLKGDLPENFLNGDIFFQDINNDWPDKVNNLDAIITSPPFFDSTRFYLANWIRLWFCGWEVNDFKTEPTRFIDELQKKNMNIYQNMFSQAKERLKNGGVLVLHLGKSKKCNMGEVLLKLSKHWFEYHDLFDESVAHCEGHGIKDKGTVSSHQYLVLR